jgi:hypothetical protein
MTEASIGLTEFLFDTICPVEAASTLAKRSLKAGLKAARRFRDQEMMATKAGRRYVSLLHKHRAEVTQLLFTDKTLARELAGLLPSVFPLVAGTEKRGAKKVSAKLLAAAEKLLTRLARRASEPLSADVRKIKREMPAFKGVTLRRGLEKLS